MNLNTTLVVSIDLQHEYRQGAAYPIVGHDAILANTSASVAVGMSVRSGGRIARHESAQ